MWFLAIVLHVVIVRSSEYEQTKISRRASNKTQYHQGLEKQIKDGVELAIKELSENESIARMVADEIKKKMNNSIVGYVLSYEVQNAIQKSIGETISNKIQEYADEVAEKIYKQLTPNK